jgi:hypothetical protein
MTRSIVFLTVVLGGSLFGADPPKATSPALTSTGTLVQTEKKQPDFTIPEVEALKLRLQEQQLQLVQTQFEKLTESLKAIQAQQQLLQLQFKALEEQRNAAASAVYKAAGVEPSAYVLDLERQKLVPKPKQ